MEMYLLYCPKNAGQCSLVHLGVIDKSLDNHPDHENYSTLEQAILMRYANNSCNRNNSTSLLSGNVSSMRVQRERDSVR